ncbi:MAG: DNA mismatch repair endonuclease MutL [Bacteroidales bacterium]|nr:DNA mismatch repair endonuclease MutL [Bacteroidales bacterium]
MPDIIQLLPDAVANQIAAGEVIQRPASVVKELVENAVDAGADEITVVIKDAGKTLIQVIDNGAGMSDTDARLAFERHATSKIKNADDLFSIRTKGFRGEALASVAAIAHVVLKTRQPDSEIGTEIEIKGSALDHQEPISCDNGSNFLVKNLFYNVPARRKFLKSNTTELKHIINEFQRIAIAHPEITFHLKHNDSDIYHLPKSNTRQRIVHIFGKSINANLNTLNNKTSLLNITGFVGKPEFAKKTTGEQFFFINKRYMRHPYFHRAVMRAYEKILPKDTFPSYFIYFDADPSTIDVNIHPTKTEIKFENEQAIFQILQASVKESLGKSNVIPSIDFNTEGVIDIPVTRKDTEFNPPEIEVNTSYNPFETDHIKKDYPGYDKKEKIPDEWEQLYAGIDSLSQTDITRQKNIFNEDIEKEIDLRNEFIQLRSKYIVTPVKSGLMIIDQKLAHERILYEQFIQSIAHNRNIAQRELYPTKIDLDPSHYILINEIKDDLALVGIDISDLGSNTIAVNSCPAGFEGLDPGDILEQLLEEYKTTEQKVGGSATKAVAASLAKAAATPYGKYLHTSEMQQIVDELFACENPNYSPDGKKIVAIVPLEQLDKLMN